MRLLLILSVFAFIVAFTGMEAMVYESMPEGLTRDIFDVCSWVTNISVGSLIGFFVTTFINQDGNKSDEP